MAPAQVGGDGANDVPVGFLEKHNPEQFETISANDIRLNKSVAVKKHGVTKGKDGTIDGKPKHVRIVIKLRKDT